MIKLIKYLFRWIDYFIYRVDMSFFQSYSLQKYGNALGIRINKNYLKFSNECHQIYSANKNLNLTTLESNPLKREGTQIIKNVLSPEQTKNVVDLLNKNIEQNKNITRHHDISIKLKNAESLINKNFYESIFNNEEVNKALLDYFGSYYQIVWSDTYRTLHAQSKSSWLWHIDNSPCKIIKVMVHYTDAGKIRGGTYFLSHSETKQFINKGYFGEINRDEDLSGFASKNGISYNPFCYEVNAGDVLLFNNNLLHRGIPPQKGYFRDVSTLLLVPSKQPWYNTLDPNKLNPPYEKASYYIYPAKNTGNPLIVSYFKEYVKKEAKWFWNKLVTGKA